MITKATIQMQPVLSWEHKTVHSYSIKDIKDAPKELQSIGDDLIKCGRVLSFIQQYPDEPVQAAVSAMFGHLASVKEYTKKRRTYSISYLTITEED